MYCTIEDITGYIDERILIQLTDSSETNIINETIIETAINDADKEIDSYLTSIIDVPIDSDIQDLNTIINLWSKKIAYWNLAFRFWGADIPDTVTAIYDKVIKELISYAKGERKFNLPTSITDTNFSVLTNKTLDDRLYTATGLRGYRITQ